jgi:predicted RNA methylase
MAQIEYPLPVDLIKPAILDPDGSIVRINAGETFRKIRKTMEQQAVWLDGSYAFAMSFYSWLKTQVSREYPITDYESSRINRHAFRQLNAKLWIAVKNHHPGLAKAPGNPWLKLFYPNNLHFLMQFSDFLGMNGAWQWYQKGVKFPVLDEALFPFYGVYFPTRFEHLILFDKWLASRPAFTRGLDVGAGCGVLSYLLMKHGANEVHATDINPNAIFGLKQQHQRRNTGLKLLAEQASFTGSFIPQTGDLLVFNPPWIPAPAEAGLDWAMYYTSGFFESFFSEACQKMKSGSKLVLLFSNFARVAGITTEHPIEQELATGGRFRLVEKLKMPVHQAPSPRKSWLSTIRRKERVELWVVEQV